MTHAQKHPLHKRVWWWLRTGHASPPGLGYFRWLKEPSRWTKPWRAWKVILGRRRGYAPPLVYIMLFALGSIIGVILDLTLDFPWWITSVALVVLAWLWFFSTIWVGNRLQYSVSLREELLGVFKPEEASARAEARMRAEISETSLRFFGLTRLQHMTPDLGWSGSDDAIDSVTLTFVEHEMPADRVHVRCIVQTLHGNVEAEHVAREAHTHIMSEALKQARDTSPPPETEEEHQARHDAIVHKALRDAEALTWSPTEMIIEADRITAHTATSHGLRFTYGRVGSEWVLVTEMLGTEPDVAAGSGSGSDADSRADTGSDVNTLHLAEIRDREPLIDRMFKPWHG